MSLFVAALVVVEEEGAVLVATVVVGVLVVDVEDSLCTGSPKASWWKIFFCC